MDHTANRRGMTLRYPATRWQDALPTGSGVVGALLYGNIQNDTVVLNHDALYYPENRPMSLDVSDQLPLMRELIRTGKCRDAAELMRTTYTKRLAAHGGSAEGGVPPYQPFCSISLGASTDGPFRNYRRGVDFDTGRAWVEWCDNTATFTRELFVSRVTDTVMLRIRSSEPGTVSCRVALGKTVSEQLDERAICHSSGGALGRSTSPSVSLESRSLMFEGGYEGGVPFGAVGQVSASGGALRATDDALVVENADELLLQVRLFIGEEVDGPLTIEDRFGAVVVEA